MTTLQPPSMPARDRQQLAVWLLICCSLIFAMVVLGGVTRLSGSGLSMVEWEPVSGVIPPLTESAWEAEFARYQQSPEYRKVNLGMTLEGFKVIFWFEYAHRLLGRTIGVVFLLPLLYFWLWRKIERSLILKLIFLFVLGGLQGLLGWYMVKSGLVDNPHVSQYRLTAHLAFAAVIYGYLLWVALSLFSLAPPAAVRADTGMLRRFALFVTGLIFVTMLSGGLVAGLKAGFAYNTFPRMAGEWVPSGILGQEPLHRNFFENAATVQFDHRVLALMALLAVLALWAVAQRSDLPSKTRLGSHVVLAVAVMQVGLGISTLLWRVPIALAAAHQAGALLLFTAALFLNDTLRRR